MMVQLQARFKLELQRHGGFAMLCERVAASMTHTRPPH
jgi:hypothetical protein